MIIITKLPCKQLSPNARLHWAKKIKYKNIDKQAGFFDTKQVMKGVKPFTKEDKLSIQITYYYADRCRRDIDNAVAASKALLDAVFLALGIDDYQVKISKRTEILYDKTNPHTKIELELI